MIEAVIFDMDGVVIDSEPFWRKAEIEIFNNIGVQMTEEMCIQMKGTKISDVVNHWHSIYQWTAPSKEKVVKRIIDRLIELIKTHGKPMPELTSLLSYLKNNSIKIGLATSSVSEIKQAVLDKLQLHSFFDATCSAESVKNGKPAPDIYLAAAQKLSVKPGKCLAIEDSFTGLKSAKAAGMFTIAIPEAPEFKLEKYNMANAKIKSLGEVVKFLQQFS